jgi:hypothetical protein
MDDLNLKHPLKFKKYRNQYNIHQRDLGISVKELQVAEKVLDAIGQCIELMDELFDEDDEDFDLFEEDMDELKERLDTLTVIYLELVAEKNSRARRPVEEVTIRIHNLPDDPNIIAAYYRFRSKEDLQRIYAALRIPQLCGKC